LILAISFLSIGASPDIIATGLAFGIVLDAVVVRSLVVPAPWSLMDAGVRDGAPLICCGVVWVSAVA